MVIKPTIAETIGLNRLHWFGHAQRMEENRIPKRVLYMNFEAMRLRGRPRNRWRDEVREDGRLVGGKGWKERVYDREEWKKLLRTARNHRIQHMPMEWMNEWHLDQVWVQHHRVQNMQLYWSCMDEVFSMRRHLASSWTLFPWHLVLLHWYRWHGRTSASWQTLFSFFVTVSDPVWNYRAVDHFLILLFPTFSSIDFYQSALFFDLSLQVDHLPHIFIKCDI